MCVSQNIHAVSHDMLPLFSPSSARRLLLTTNHTYTRWLPYHSQYFSYHIPHRSKPRLMLNFLRYRLGKISFMSSKPQLESQSFYDLHAVKPDGSQYEFSDLKDKVVLIVNVASQWYWFLSSTSYTWLMRSKVVSPYSIKDYKHYRTNMPIRDFWYLGSPVIRYDFKLAWYYHGSISILVIYLTIHSSEIKNQVLMQKLQLSAN